VTQAMTTVGYGDLYANTFIGEIFIFLVFVIGLFLISLAFTSLMDFLDLSLGESNALYLIKEIDYKD
jgi:hypothetical protein